MNRCSICGKFRPAFLLIIKEEPCGDGLEKDKGVSIIELKEETEKVVTYAFITEDCKGIVGSLGCFQKELRDKGFSGKRVRITYEIVSLEQEGIERTVKE